MTEGSVNPHDILKIKGIYAVQSYLLHEVQKVYRLQGVDINDKHVEVIVRQMMKRVKVEEAGDTELLPGSLVDMFTFNDANERAIEAGLRPAEGRTLLGITKASWLQIHSFQLHLSRNHKSFDRGCNKGKNRSIVRAQGKCNIR